MMLHLQTVPARNGLIWVRHGLKVVQRQPFALIGLFSLTMLVWTLLSLTVVGSLVTVASVPLVCLGFMLASHQVLQSHTPTVAVFTQPLQLTPERRKAQLLLGLLSVVLSVVISQISIWVAGGAMDQLADMAKAGTQPDPAAVVAVMTDPRMVQATMTFFGLLTLVSIPLWHAPALIHWGGQGVIQSLFSSTLGVWKNRGAFFVSGLAWVVLTFVCSIAVSLVAALLGSPMLATLLQVPVFFVLFTAFLCSLYFTFIDCFMFGAPRDLPVPPARKAGTPDGGNNTLSSGIGTTGSSVGTPSGGQTHEPVKPVKPIEPVAPASAPSPSDAGSSEPHKLQEPSGPVNGSAPSSDFGTVGQTDRPQASADQGAALAAPSQAPQAQPSQQPEQPAEPSQPAEPQHQNTDDSRPR